MPVQMLEAPSVADVGDTLRYWLIVSDYDGVAASATVTATVTKPDASTAAMTVTAQATAGLYLITFDTAAAGRHLVSITVSSASFDDDVVPLDVYVMAASGSLPDLTALKAYLGTTSWSDAELTDALNAETAAQRAACRIPAAYPDDLAQALKRRVQCNLARRLVPLGVMQGDGAGGQTPYVPGRDPEVRRLEAPYRRLVVL